jgi:hypothetical protein
MSLGLYYQMIGRGIRPHPDKDYCLVMDLCGNRKRFGKIENLHIHQGEYGKYCVMSEGRPLTNVYLQTRQQSIELPFGAPQFKGKPMDRLPRSYLQWIVKAFKENINNGKFRPPENIYLEACRILGIAV